MAKNIVFGGDKIRPWTNGTGSAVVSGQVVRYGPAVLGIALGDIAAGAVGEVCLNGAASVPKASGAVIAQGETLTWDVSAANFDDNAATPASGDVTGAACFALEAAGNGVTSLLVQFTGVPGTKT